MLCKNCGNEVSNTERFCGKCGAPVEQATASAPTPAPAKPASNMNFDFNAIMQKVKTDKFMRNYAIVAILFLCQLMFWFADAVKVSAYGVSENVTMSDLLKSENQEFMTFVMLVLFGASIAFCVMVLIKDAFKKETQLYLPLAASVISLVYYVFMVFSQISKAKDAMGSYASMIDIGVAFTGWLYIICAIGSTVLLAMIFNDMKKSGRL